MFNITRRWQKSYVIFRKTDILHQLMHMTVLHHQDKSKGFKKQKTRKNLFGIGFVE